MRRRDIQRARDALGQKAEFELADITEAEFGMVDAIVMLDVLHYIDYESQLNEFAPRYPQVIMCLYDLDWFGGQILVDILKTHPKVLMGSTILENLHYLEPDEFLASRER